MHYDFRLLALGLIGAAALGAPRRPMPGRPIPGTGALIIPGETQQVCPLKHTDVKAEITGFFSRVTVTQDFENPLREKIEAVYTFPLPQNAAVDDMTIHIGDRTIKGKIKRKEEAQAIYNAARDAGYSAALLDQERPNIFTQSVANIRPGEKVKVEIRYIETLPYEDGSFQFMFPMVVGPRYIPQGTDGSRVTPPVTKPGMRAGHDISISVDLDAGLPIYSIRSSTHDIDQQKTGDNHALIKLRTESEIPDRDFVLKYDLAGKGIGDTVLSHHDARGGFFTMILQPPAAAAPQEITPRELVFVLDTSGSMSGFPIEKAKETMRLALHDLNPRDTFNLITFSGETRILFPQPVPATSENLRVAESILRMSAGGGGTEMMKAIRASLDSSDKQDHVRVVCFMTDGYVGNDLDIIAEVQKHPNARVFAFGIGSSVNRFLLDKMAEAGRGEVEYVNLQDDGSAAARRFYQRVHNPLLTDVSIDWNGLVVSEVYPQRIPDLFSAKPVVVTGRYSGAAHGTVHLRGKIAGHPFSRDIAVAFPAGEPKHEVLATLWARRKVDDLMSRDWVNAQGGHRRGEYAEPITQLGLDYHLMTQFTSFVAVEESVITEGGKPRRVEVPVEMPHGVSYEGVFGGPMPVAMSAPMGGSRKASAGIFGGFLPRSNSREAAAPMPQPIAQFQSAPPKLDTALVALVQNPAIARDTKKEVLILLTDTSAATLDKLKQLGFELTFGPNSAGIVAGRITVGKLEELAALSAVRTITPR